MVYAISIILESVLDISFLQTLGIIGVITIVYSLQGGMKAVVYGDMIQMIILFVGILICMFYGLSYLDGWAELSEKLDPARLQAVDFSSWGFREGEEFGFGVDLGVCTQKLHVRGPIGPHTLTASKYVIWGDGGIHA